MKPTKIIRYVIIFTCLCALSAAKAQDNKEYNPKAHVGRVNLFGLFGFSFEKGIGKNFTIRPEAGLGVPVFTETDVEGGKNKVHFESAVNPYIMVEARYYYNLKKRFDAGKRISYFGADYIGPFYRYNAYQYLGAYDPDTENKNDVLLRDIQYAGFWWGLQRNFGPKQCGYFNWSIGPAVKTNFKDYADFTVFGQIGLGFQW